MRCGVWAATGALAASLCGASPSPEDAVSLGPDLSVRAIRPGYWVHTSVRVSDGVPANGMIVRTPKGLVLVDTGWTEDQALRLVEWAETTVGGRVVEAVVTHSHEDRSGGAPALYRRKIHLISLDLTASKLRDGGAQTTPEPVVSASKPVYDDPLGFEVFYPGAGHAGDNVVVWLPEAKVLFGGCLVKAQAAADLGFVGDADLASWPKAVEAVRKRYGTAAIVVPGHGEIAGPAALVHTLELLRKRP
jgi:metallo-beta-lactamase class B